MVRVNDHVRWSGGPPIPVIDLIILPQSSHGVGVFIRYNDDAQVLGDRTMYIAIFTTWALLVAVIAGSKFCARRASCSAIAVANHVQKLGGRSKAH